MVFRVHPCHLLMWGSPAQLLSGYKHSSLIHSWPSLEISIKICCTSNHSDRFMTTNILLLYLFHLSLYCNNVIFLWGILKYQIRRKAAAGCRVCQLLLPPNVCASLHPEEAADLFITALYFFHGFNPAWGKIVLLTTWVEQKSQNKTWNSSSFLLTSFWHIFFSINPNHSEEKHIFQSVFAPTLCVSSCVCTAGTSPPTGGSCSSCWPLSLSQFSSSCSDKWSFFHGAISESSWNLKPKASICFFPALICIQLRTWALLCVRSPHAERVAAQVIPALVHVVQTFLKHNAVLWVSVRAENPLSILIQGVIQLCVVVNLWLKVLFEQTCLLVNICGK